jgi:hypothetical protein
MAELTGNTASTLKKYLPKIKTKAIENVPAFEAFINGTSGSDISKATPTANRGTKRKAEKYADDNKTSDMKTEGSNEGIPATDNEDELSKKKVAGKGKGRGKKAASQEGEVSAEADGEEKEKPKAKPKAKPRGKKAKSDDEEKENGIEAEEGNKPALKKPRGKAAKKAKMEGKEDADEPAKETKMEQVEDEA